jgi:hypothetical protein
MSYDGLLVDRCVIQARSVNSSGMDDTESWSSGTSVPCRKLTRSTVKGNADKTQFSTVISTRFALLISTAISPRDRILHEGRIFTVIDVLSAFDARKKRIKTAICEAIIG